MTGCLEGETPLMRIHNLYVDDAGETHFRDIEVEWVEEWYRERQSRT